MFKAASRGTPGIAVGVAANRTPSTSSRFEAGSVLMRSTRFPESASFTAVAQATEVIHRFADHYRDEWLAQARRKLGLDTAEDGDQQLADDWLAKEYMRAAEAIEAQAAPSVEGNVR